MKYLLILFSLFICSCKSNSSLVDQVNYEWFLKQGKPLEITGRIISESNKNVSNMRIRLESDSGTLTEKTDSEGNFRIMLGEERLRSISVMQSELREKIDCSQGVRFLITIP